MKILKRVRYKFVLFEVEKKLMRNNDAPNEDLQKFKRMLVNHIENRILNSQK